MVILYANKIIRLVHATLCDGPQSRFYYNEKVGVILTHMPALAGDGTQKIYIHLL